MDRRDAIFALGGLIASTLTGCGNVGSGSVNGSNGQGNQPVYGDQSCNLTGAPLPTASVDIAQFYQQAAQPQLLNMWCWAASISMVFADRNHPVSQARIVSTVYGAPYDIGAIGLQIAQALNREWVDDNGVPFFSMISGLYDAQSGIFALTNDQIVNSLQQGEPLILGTASPSHARVLIEVNYNSTPFGVQIGGAKVFDPATASLQCLLQQDMTPTNLGGNMQFLASISIT